MNIACVGWGSLIWDSGSLPFRSDWFSDGPLLPVEFARHSSRDRVTLVIIPTFPSVRTFWCLMNVDNLNTACHELAKRESVEKSRDRNIGFWTRTSGSSGKCVDVIGEWAITQQLDFVVWTNLGPKWENKEGQIPSVGDVLEFVRSQGPDSEAADYIRKTPDQILTGYRQRMHEEFDWLE